MAIYGMIVKYYKHVEGEYKCLHCNYKGKSFMGIQSHIRKHKREMDIYPYGDSSTKAVPSEQSPNRNLIQSANADLPYRELNSDIKRNCYATSLNSDFTVTGFQPFTQIQPRD